jgi:hypothetical protein
MITHDKRNMLRRSAAALAGINADAADAVILTVVYTF